jgi:hypothetical protein
MALLISLFFRSIQGILTGDEKVSNHEGANGQFTVYNWYIHSSIDEKCKVRIALFNENIRKFQKAFSGAKVGPLYAFIAVSPLLFALFFRTR